MDAEEKSFDEVVQEWRGKFFTFAYRMVGNYADAEDIAQEALTRVHSARSEFTPGTNIHAWLYKITRNCALRYI
jgi:RNA polymerase sigma-70 factor (ECF subfamily)